LFLRLKSWLILKSEEQNRRNNGFNALLFRQLNSLPDKTALQMQSAEETKKRFMEAMQKRKKMEEQSRLAKDALENKLKDAEERRLTLSQPSEERGRRMEAAQQKLRQMKLDQDLKKAATEERLQGATERREDIISKRKSKESAVSSGNSPSGKKGTSKQCARSSQSSIQP